MDEHLEGHPQHPSTAMEKATTTQSVVVVPPQALRRVKVAIERTDEDYSQLYASMESLLADRDTSQWGEIANQLDDPMLGEDTVFGVTSAVPGEGKTTIAMHLAFSIARNTGKKVCLIDLGLGNNEICQRMGVRTEKGLIDILEGRDYVIRTLQLSDCGDLCVIPAGKQPRNPNRAARSAAVTEVMAAARELYDTVVVDLPAISTGNALPIAEHLDKVLLVVGAGATPRDVVQQAMDRIGRHRILGVILNRTKSATPNWLMRRLFPRH